MLLSTQNCALVHRFGHMGAIDVLKQAGFDAIDLSLFAMVSDDDEFCTDGYRERIAEIRAYAESQGLHRFGLPHSSRLFPRY